MIWSGYSSSLDCLVRSVSVEGGLYVDTVAQDFRQTRWTDTG